MTEVQTLQRIVRRLRWRRRVQTSLRWGAIAAIAAACVLVAGVVAYELWWLQPGDWSWVLGVAVAIVGVGLVAGLFRRFDRIGLAQLLDHSHDLKDRLGTALELLSKPETQRSDFEKAQLRDAAQHARRVEPSRAAPWVLPRELIGVLALIGLAWGLTFLDVAPPQRLVSGLPLVSFQQSLPTPPPPSDSPLREEPESAQWQEEVEIILAETQEELAPLAKEDVQALEFVKELNRTLQGVADGRIDDRRLAQEIGELEQALTEMDREDGAQASEYEQTAETLEQVGQALEQRAGAIQEEEVEELGQMLRERRYEEAADHLEELLERFRQLPEAQQRQLARMLERTARQFQSQLDRRIQDLQRRRDRLQRQAEQREEGPSRRQRDRLNRMERQLDRLSQRQERRSSEEQRNLDRLGRDMRDLADRMRRRPEQQRGQQQQQGQQGQQENQQQAQEQQDGPESRRRRANQESMRQMRETLRRMGQGQRRQRLRRRGRMQLGDLRELMRRRQRMRSGERRRQQLARGRGQRGRGQRQGREQGQQGQSGQSQGMQGARPGQQDPHRSVEWMRSASPSDAPTRRGGARDGEGAGHGRNRMMNGPATDIQAQLESDFVPGQRTQGPSRREILYGASTRGARVPGYGEMHIDYSVRAAQQMEREEVPPGYREHVEEYFRLIRR